MKVSHIEHLGIAVKSLDEAIPYWENVLGLKCYAVEEVADQKVRTAFFMLGQTKIELLEPTSEESTIAKYIENRGVGIHHMALACENIEEQLADAEAKGIRLIDKTPRKGAEGMTIAFLHPKSTQGILGRGGRAARRTRLSHVRRGGKPPRLPAVRDPSRQRRGIRRRLRLRGDAGQRGK